MRLNIINKVNLRLTRESSNNMLFMKKIKQNIFKGHLEMLWNELYAKYAYLYHSGTI
jgi:hypothetical protein